MGTKKYHNEGKCVRLLIIQSKLSKMKRFKEDQLKIDIRYKTPLRVNMSIEFI